MILYRKSVNAMWNASASVFMLLGVSAMPIAATPSGKSNGPASQEPLICGVVSGMPPASSGSPRMRRVLESVPYFIEMAERFADEPVNPRRLPGLLVPPMHARVVGVELPAWLLDFAAPDHGFGDQHVDALKESAERSTGIVWLAIRGVSRDLEVFHVRDMIFPRWAEESCLELGAEDLGTAFGIRLTPVESSLMGAVSDKLFLPMADFSAYPFVLVHGEQKRSAISPHIRDTVDAFYPCIFSIEIVRDDAVDSCRGDCVTGVAEYFRAGEGGLRGGRALHLAGVEFVLVETPPDQYGRRFALAFVERSAGVDDAQPDGQIE